MKGETQNDRKKYSEYIYRCIIICLKICAWQHTKGMFNYALLESLTIYLVLLLTYFVVKLIFSMKTLNG